LGGIPDWGVIYQMIHTGNHFKPAPANIAMDEAPRKKGLFGIFG
jgi:hypothetical protein